VNPCATIAVVFLLMIYRYCVLESVDVLDRYMLVTVFSGIDVPDGHLTTVQPRRPLLRAAAAGEHTDWHGECWFQSI